MLNSFVQIVLMAVAFFPSVKSCKTLYAGCSNNKKVLLFLNHTAYLSPNIRVIAGQFLLLVFTDFIQPKGNISEFKRPHEPVDFFPARLKTGYLDFNLFRHHQFWFNYELALLFFDVRKSTEAAVRTEIPAFWIACFLVSFGASWFFFKFFMTIIF